jgi:uncharacterized protein DUF4276
VTVKIYVEGGGDHNKALKVQCRHGFSEFLQKVGLKGRMPSIVACGGRQQAYTRFRNSHRNDGQDTISILLVDSEGPVINNKAWKHVKSRPDDRWECPQQASEVHLHLMVQTMEAWFHADKDALRKYYGKGFREAALNQRKDIEDIPKADLYAGMMRATRDCQKGEYSKGRHSFQILALIDPAMVRASSRRHAERLCSLLQRICGQ